ncbi:uncharacterized protein LTR77_005203 [Saxophila tyrrhenica]|uniref:Peptidase S53 activation domain-containing protein n=1 Tax=Saxophila tyrrhenica TaxID=1690608 RepID=A0AAV9PDQ8_9PEZI|nr:hypothetical protein LTR77_005203 [Saxophila tyrrhenica]
MKTLSSLGLWATLLLAFSSTEAIGTPHEKRMTPLHDVVARRRLHERTVLPMRIGLKQNPEALAKAEAWLMSISNPASKDYGSSWSQDDIVEAFAPSDEAISNVTGWLHSAGVLDFTHSDNKLWIAFEASSDFAESLLQTQYEAHTLADGSLQAACNEYHLPEHVRQYVDYVTPGVKGSEIVPRRRLPAKRQPNVRNISAVQLLGLQLEQRPRTPPALRTVMTLLLQLALGRCMIFRLRIHMRQSVATTRWLRYKQINGTQDFPALRNNSTFDQPYVFEQLEADLDVACALPIVYPQNITMFQTPYSSHATRNTTLAEITRNDTDSMNTFLDAIDGSYCKYKDQTSPTGGKLECGIFKPPNVLSISYGWYERDYPPMWQERQCNE